MTQLQAQGCNALAIQADVSIEFEVIAMFNYLDEHLGKITALVNNAGILQPQIALG